jgi:modulator of FtsH protease HflC
MDTHGHDQAGITTEQPPAKPSSRRRATAFAAAIILLAALLAASAVTTHAGTATLITQFGRPVRVITEPGLTWKLPTPIETTTSVDLRLHTTSSDPQDTGTKDGARILVQAFATWQTGTDPADIAHFVSAVRNDPDQAASQIRGLINAEIQRAAAGFALNDLVNTNPQKIQLAAFESTLRTQLAPQLRSLYGVQIREIGIERLSLPASTLAATIAQMRSERDTIAAQRTAEGEREAGQIRADAARDSRIMIADAQTQAAQIEATARSQAADIQARAYTADPALYTLLRSLDTLGNVIGPNTRLVLRTDAAPFNVLVNGPPNDVGSK